MVVYHLPEPVVNSTPVTGRYLSHNHLGRIARAFVAADRAAGAKQLVRPTLTQAAHLARANVTYAWWARKRMAERAAIEAGLIPLVPALPVSKPNGSTLPMLITGQIPDGDLIALIRATGVDRVLAAACAVEAAQ